MCYFNMIFSLLYYRWLQNLYRKQYKWRLCCKLSISSFLWFCPPCLLGMRRLSCPLYGWSAATTRNTSLRCWTSTKSYTHVRVIIVLPNLAQTACFTVLLNQLRTTRNKCDFVKKNAMDSAPLFLMALEPEK